MCTSGRRVRNTTPPAKMLTANFVSTCVNNDVTDKTIRAVGENRRSRNSGIV